MVCLTVCLTVCLSYCLIVCFCYYAKSCAKILLFLHICKQNPKNMQNLPISAFFCFFSLCALFAHHCANLLSPLSEAGGGFSFFISVAYLRQFSPAFFPFSSFFFYRQIVFAALLCPLRRDLIPTKTPPKSPFRPKNLIILTFPSSKICIYHFFVLSLHPISGFLSPTNPLIH